MNFMMVKFRADDETVTYGWTEASKVKKNLRVKIENDSRWWTMVEIYADKILDQKELDSLRTENLEKQTHIL